MASATRSDEKIGTDAVDNVLRVNLSDEELASRRQKWEPRQISLVSGAIWKYAHTIGLARDGMVTHPGGKTEKICYADQ